MRELLVGALSLSLLSCVSYDFEPVEPYALTIELKAEKKVGTIPANVMLVIDKSGSMDLPMNPSDPDCGSCGQNKSALCDPSSCATRWSELQTAMNAFLPNSEGITRFGLVTYPSDAVCGAPGTVRVGLPATDDAAQLKSHAAMLNTVIQGISSQGTSGTPNTTGGGTPTARALQLLLSEPAFVQNDRREDLAVLLTDGLPNCNANNPNSWTTNPTACRCTLGTDCSAYPREGCLDDSSTLAQIQALRSRDIRVVVVGFGAEVSSGAGPDVLRAMAAAGGWTRKCQSAADCAVGDSCTAAGACSSGLFLPTNSAELTALMREISQRDLCLVQLSEPAQPSRMEVRVAGRILSPSEWTLAGTQVEVLGGACEKLKAATPENEVDFQVWVVRALPEN